MIGERLEGNDFYQKWKIADKCIKFYYRDLITSLKLGV